MVSLLRRNPSQASLTRDSLLREVKLFGFMKKRFNFAMSKPTVLSYVTILLQLTLHSEEKSGR